ncbi:MAG TPA: methyl-accepting chemotaxis protein, partial [Magnetospirillum sp.]|nr:methyl-accepting chemotaxis protein [Magnetospirillum sp.]
MRASDIRFGFRLMAITLVATIGLASFGAFSLNTLYDQLVAEKKEKTKEHVEVAASIVNGMVRDAASGTITQAEAKTKAMEALRSARYAGVQYFWINDMDGRMLMHPTNPKLVDTSVLTLKSAAGQPIFTDMIEVVRKSGGGFYQYLWQLPSEDRPRPKISYVVGVPEWNWVIGTGVYMDDIDALFREQALRLGGIGVMVLLLIVGLSAAITRGVVHPIAAIVEEMRQLAQGKHDTPDYGIDRRDEIGDIARSVQVFKRNLVEKTRLESESETVKREAESLRRAEMSRMANEFQASVGQVVDTVAASSDAMENTAETMAALAGQVRAQADAVAAASEQAAANVETVAAATEELSGSVTEIGRQVEESARIARNAV